MNKRPSIRFQILVVIAVTIGPIGLLIRGAEITPLEKFVYVMSLFPLALVAMVMYYREKKEQALHDLDLEEQAKNLAEISNEWRRVILYGVVLMLAAGCLYGWIIFVRFPS